MGTSRSSTGSPSGVPLVPPWVDSVEPVADDGQQVIEQPGKPEEEGVDPAVAPKIPPSGAIPPIAPPGRFRSTRISLGKYAKTGDADSMRQGVGRYFKHGLGGSGTGSKRFAKTGQVAQRLYSTLGGSGPGGGGTAQPSAADLAFLNGKSGQAICDAIVEIACPVDGSQDAEASRNSINDALAELLQRYADADLHNLTEEQREFVIDRFVSMDVYRRFMLDVGTAIQDKAPSYTVALSRLKEAKNYIREVVVDSFQKLRNSGQRLSGNRISQIVSSALSDAIFVFAGYAE